MLTAAEPDRAPAPPAYNEYAHRTQQLERAIDADPLESVNHLALADLHEENGTHDEAAFRRSMGQWVGGGGPEYHVGWDQWLVPGDRFPPGVHSGDVESRPVGGPVGALEHVRDHAPHIAFRRPRGANRAVSDYHSWATYRHMEEGLRRAFMAARQRGNPC